MDRKTEVMSLRGIKFLRQDKKSLKFNNQRTIKNICTNKWKNSNSLDKNKCIFVANKNGRYPKIANLSQSNCL